MGQGWVVMGEEQQQVIPEPSLRTFGGKKPRWSSCCLPAGLSTATSATMLQGM